MVVQRRENDKEIEDVREEANAVEIRVNPVAYRTWLLSFSNPDERASQNE